MARGHRHCDGPGICNEKKGVQRMMPHGERPHVNALPPFSCSAGGSLVSPVQHPGGSSNSINVTENTDKGWSLKMPGRSTGVHQRGYYAPVVGARGLGGGGGKMEVFDLPGFGVLLSGIPLYNVYEFMSRLKPDQDPMDHYAVKLFT